MANMSPVIMSLFVLAVFVIPQVCACDITAAATCGTDYASDASGKTGTGLCPALTEYTTCLNTACQNGLSQTFQDALNAAKGSIDCSGAGHLGGSLFYMTTLTLVALFFVRR